MRGQEERRSVGVGGRKEALADEVGVLVGLAADEDGAHHEGEGVPLPKSPAADLQQ